MKTKKILFALFAVVTTFFAPRLAAEDQPKYYVAVAWEYTYGSPGKSQPVISNVVYVKCDWHNSKLVINSFNNYYDAYHAKKRGTTGLNREIGFMFDTRDEAVEKRRELIADYNRDWSPLLVDNFSVTCKD